MQYVGIVLSYFSLSLVIRNVWPQRMSLKAFIMLSGIFSNSGCASFFR